MVTMILREKNMATVSSVKFNYDEKSEMCCLYLSSNRYNIPKLTKISPRVANFHLVSTGE